MENETFTPTPTPADLSELQLEELRLRIEELKLKTEELSIKLSEERKTYYRRFSFWTTSIPILIAVGTVFTQFYISKYEKAKAELELAQTADTIRKAKIASKELTEQQIKLKTDINTLKDKRLRLLRDLDKALTGFVDINNVYGYSKNYINLPVADQKIVEAVNKNLSGMLISGSSDLLVKNSILKIYYDQGLEKKAEQINSLLKTKGAKSEFLKPPYSLGGVLHNRIVYYNKPQENYCNAVAKLLKDSGYGDFAVMQSSGANPTTGFFKIYLVR